MSEQTNPVTNPTKPGPKRRLTQIETLVLDRTAELGLPLNVVLESDNKLAAFILEQAVSGIRTDLIEERLLDNNEYLRKRIQGEQS